MENYLTIAQRWADLKREILVEHERVTPLVNQIIEDFKRISGQDIPAEHIGTACKLVFYPYLGGFVYSYSCSWHSTPDVHRHWEWSLNESKQVLIFLKSMNEVELKLLFSQWAEKYCV